MLKHLYDLAVADHLLDDLDFEWKPVRYFIELGGDTVSLTDRRISTLEGTKVVKEVPLMRVPARVGRSREVKSNFMVDNPKYVFGWSPTKKDDEPSTRPEECHEAFREKILVAYNRVEDEGVKKVLSAILAFLDLPLEERIAPLKALLGDDPSVDQLQSVGSEYAFRCLSYKPIPVHLYPELENIWTSMCAVEESEPTSFCVVTGDPCTPIEYHPKVSVPGAGSMPIPLFSFNKSAFESHGLSGNANCPMSPKASRAVALAMGRLLSRNPGRSSKDKNIYEKLGLRNVNVGDGITASFWVKTPPSEESAEPDFLMMGLNDPNPSALTNLLNTPRNGHTPALLDPSHFMMLVIEGVSGRPIFRSFTESTTKQVAENVLKYAQDIQIIKPPRKDGLEVYPSVYALASSLNGSKSKSSPTSAYVLALTKTAFHGSPLPRVILQAAVNKIGAEGPYDSKYNFFKRLALIKLFLNRNTPTEVTMSLDPTNVSPAYLCGRLMALYEKVQLEAQGGSLGRTVIDSHYRSFRNTPAVVNPVLMDKMNYYMKKLRRENYGTMIYWFRQFAEITNSLTQFPSRLTLEGQGLFDLGYAHQRSFFYKPTEDAEVLALSEETL